MYYFLFHFYNVLIRLLLIYSLGWLVNQSQLMSLITNQECFKVRKYFEISDNFVYSVIGYFECSFASVDREHSNCFLVIAAEIKGVFLF